MASGLFPSLRLLLCGITAAAAALSAHGSGSGYNTVVVINRASPNSCELGNYYAQARNIPPENVLHISWPGSNISWSSNDFYTVLLAPLRTMIADRGLSNQVRFVALSMAIPYRTMQGTTPNGTSSAIFYGLKPDTFGSRNSFYLSELPTEAAVSVDGKGPSLLAAFLTSDSLELSKQMIDSSIAADQTFPTRPAALAKSTDLIRSLRRSLFDNAVLDVELLSRSRIYRTNSDAPWNTGKLMGAQIGLANFTIGAGSFCAGSIADSLTSFGGQLFEPSGQTSLLEFIKAGASASYGTVAEPGADTARFPNPLVYFYQARGFNLVECYYQSLSVPQFGIIVGDPLCAPFQRAAAATWLNTNQVVHGIFPISAQFSGPSGENVISGADLFIDGRFAQAVTNVSPMAGNAVEVVLNGYPLRYSVQPGATLSSISAGVAAIINAASNITRITATNFGDRVELRSWATHEQFRSWYFWDTSATNAGRTYYRARYLPDPILPLLGIEAPALGQGPSLVVRSPVGMPYILETSTNLAHWQPVQTNLSGADLRLVDDLWGIEQRRFYRVAGIYATPTAPLISVQWLSAGAELRVDAGQNTGPYVLQSSDDLSSWTGLITNTSGATTIFLDSESLANSRRFYRTAPVELEAPKVFASTVSGMSGRLVRVDGAGRPYVLESSRDLVSWKSCVTNMLFDDVQLSVRTTQGAASELTTFAKAARPDFLTRRNRGSRVFTLTGTASPASQVTLTCIQTNGASTLVTARNSAGGPMLELAQALADAVNTNATLSNLDGIEATDIFTNSSGAAYITFSARGSGAAAAAVRVQITGSSGVSPVPGLLTALDSNLSDLQPRNHLYLAAGREKLGISFGLDSTALADGFHEISAIAYEGTHTRGQTRVSMNVVVTNTPLFAELSIVDGVTNASTQDTIRVQVVANTNTISRIDLFSTGGLLQQQFDSATADFRVAGADLGAGRHPFYAVLEATNGTRFRTATRYVQFTR